MRRRDILSAGMIAATATAVRAEEARPEPTTYDLTAIGLPVIAGNRIRNYVFVRFRLHLAEGHDPMSMREKDPFLRDSVVRGGHRRPFTVEGDWNRLNAGAMAGWVVAAAATICGRGVVRRVEVLSQEPQRRVRAG